MSEKFERCEIFAMFISAGPPFVMSRTDAQNGLDSIFNSSIEKSGFENINLSFLSPCE